MTVPRLRAALRGSAPGTNLERRAWEAGYTTVVGVDEVGRGAWAGPLTVGAVMVPRDRRLYKVRDSKMLTENEREVMYDRIVAWAEAWAVGHVTPEECDRLGMSEAQRLAARRAIERLGVRPDRVLVDGSWDFVGGGIAETLVRGDSLSVSIAAASIIAKVSRDRIMRQRALDHPAFNFEGNKGYPCPIHKAALQGWGPSAIHRRSWSFMDGLVWTGVRRLSRDEPKAISSVQTDGRPDRRQQRLF